ncbi:unnamed protein product [Peniophora sp. CBMAI 1063]|nr:unnamed protein product [Peniophora sp. CBMAI 1063]
MVEKSSTIEEQAAVSPEEQPLLTGTSPAGSPQFDEVIAARHAYALYKQTWDLAHLETTIVLFQRVVDATPVPTAYVLGWLGHCLGLHYEARGNIDDLQHAVVVEQKALQLTREGHPDRALRLHNLSISLRMRFESLGALDDLRIAIQIQRDAVELTPSDNPDLPVRLDNLGSLQWLRSRRFGKLEDLETAIASQQRATELTPDNHPDKATRLHNLASSLRSRFERLDDPADLERAIAIQRRAIELTPNGHPDLPVRLDNLGSSQRLRYRRFGELEDLESAIAAHNRATELTPDDHLDVASRLHNLASSLHHRFERLDDPADLDRAITIQCRAAELSPDDHPNLPARLNNLGSFQRLYFRRFGRLEDLESAIASQQRASELTPNGHPDEASRLHNLASSLRSRFERLDDPADLERAIAIQRRVIELTPDDLPALPVRLDSLSSIQRLRFRRFGMLEDLESAIASQQRATELTPHGHPDRATRLHNFALSLSSRFERLDDTADLERAITIQRCAVELTPDTHPDLSVRLENLGGYHQLRFRRFGELEDIERAIAELKRAVKLSADGHPEKAILLHNLALSLVVDFCRERTVDRFAEALSCFMSASSQSLVSPAKHLQIANHTIKLLNDNPEFGTAEMLLLAHSRVLDVLSEVVWLGHTMKRRLEESQQLGQLVSSAVCAAVGVDALAQAVEWLDAGRALIWAQTMSLRSPLHELGQVRPDLARTLADVQVQLQNSINATSRSDVAEWIDAIPGAGAHSYTSDRHRRLAIEYSKLLAEVHLLPGFESFLLPKKLSALLPSTTPLCGSLVFINANGARCDALLLLPNGCITAHTLPELSLAKAETLRARWQAYLMQQDIRERGICAQCQYRSDSTSSPHDILNRLWRWIVGPVLKALGVDIVDADADRLPHITWCPTGPLTQLPLHAAGIYDDIPGPRVYDFVVSSYTPSLSAMTRSIDAFTQQHTAPGILVVTQPDTPGTAPLPGTRHEGARLHSVFAASQIPSTALNGGEATANAVKLALREHSWLHLACHGRQEMNDPLKSAFALYDGPLSLSDLMVTTADNAELAFLSACQTAVGDEKIPEESMHLAAGMLAVGYKGVIATMWSIRDNDAPLIVEAYYKRLLDIRGAGTLGAGETGAAYALHEAAAQLRERVGEREFLRWAPFVHFGI